MTMGPEWIQSGARAELEMGQEEKLDEESRPKGEPKPKPKQSRKRQMKRQAMAGSHTHGVNNRPVRTMNRCQLRLTAPAAAPAHPKGSPRQFYISQNCLLALGA